MKLAEKENKMVSSFAWDLFKDPFFIGFNREMERLSNVQLASRQVSYPPYDLVKVDDDNFKLSLAVAGFSKDNISVTVDNSTLIIKGDSSLESEEEKSEVLHKGIAARKFTRTFALGEYMEITGAEMKDGMLHIDIERIVPEEKKPKEIAIKVAKK
jgi:molecular chaperone IbpA